MLSAAGPSSTFECGLYVAPSTIPHLGRGVFTGRSYSANETLEVAATLAMRHGDIETTMLNNYVFGTGEDGISMAELGPGMVYNHRLPTNYYRVWDESPQVILFEEQVEAYTTYKGIQDIAVHDLEAGEEVFGKYCEVDGPCDWFVQRGIAFADYRAANGSGSGGGGVAAPGPGPAKRSLAQLAAEGHCLTQVRVGPSTIPGAGKGLFASRAFSPGEIVTISPVLLLATAHVDDGSGGDHSVLINYCTASPRASVALLPFGLAALANHGPSPAAAAASANNTANMHPEWFFWDESTSFSTPVPDTNANGNGNGNGNRNGNGNGTRALLHSTPLTALAAQPFTQLDLAYRATRAIAAGEELFVSYGEAWAEAYAQYDTALQAHGRNASEAFDVLLAGRSPAALAPQELDILQRQRQKQRPRFRKYIGDPHGLFLPHWLDLPEHTASAPVPGPAPAAAGGIPAPLLSLLSFVTYERLRPPAVALTSDSLVVTLPLATCAAVVAVVAAGLLWWHVCLRVVGWLLSRQSPPPSNKGSKSKQT